MALLIRVLEVLEPTDQQELEAGDRGAGHDAPTVVKAVHLNNWIVDGSKETIERS